MNGPQHYREGEQHLSAASHLDRPGGKPVDPTASMCHLMAAQAHFAAAQAAAAAARLADRYIGDGPHINDWLNAIGCGVPAETTSERPVAPSPSQKAWTLGATPEAWANLGQALREKRESKNLSRRALSEIAEVSEKSIQIAEEGRVPSKRWPQSLDRIASALGWSAAGVVDFILSEPPF